MTEDGDLGFRQILAQDRGGRAIASAGRGLRLVGLDDAGFRQSGKEFLEQFGLGLVPRPPRHLVPTVVGYQTASGEILDTVTATAAHRSLPLASYARVTNLDNGRSVIVKINDRGPYTRGRIIDLSPRAADVLDIKRAGVAAVAVESLRHAAERQRKY
jgi:hypothetical protein